MKKIALIVCSSFLMAACVGMPRNAEQIAVYDFGMVADGPQADADWSAIALEVRAPGWFDSLGVDYRLAYDDPLKLREYAFSRWAGTPGVLLAQRLNQQLGTAGASGTVAVECLLRVELQEFSQVFSTPTQSRGLLQASVTLTDARRQPLAGRAFLVESPAATPDAPGGVGALVAAGTSFGRQLDGWLAGLGKTGALKRCAAGH